MTAGHENEKRRTHSGVFFRPISGIGLAFTEGLAQIQFEVLAAGTIGHLSAHAPLVYCLRRVSNLLPLSRPEGVATTPGKTLIGTSLRI